MKPCALLLSASLSALALAACGAAPQPAAETGSIAVAEPSAEAGVDAAEVVRVEGIAIHDPWLRQPPPSARVSAGYLRIDNSGAEADRLMAVETGAAGRVEIHAMEEVDGVMRMRKVEGGLDIPAGGHVALQPGGYHLMLMEPREGLQAGQQVDAALVFERAGRVELTFDVRPPGAGAGGHGDGHGH